MRKFCGWPLIVSKAVMHVCVHPCMCASWILKASDIRRWLHTSLFFNHNLTRGEGFSKYTHLKQYRKNIAKGVDCFNQINNQKNQPTSPQATLPLSHHAIAPNIENPIVTNAFWFVWFGLVGLVW